MCHWLRELYMSIYSIVCDAVELCACAVCLPRAPCLWLTVLTRPLPARLCVPESAARRVMEHALLNDESEYSRERASIQKSIPETRSLFGVCLSCYVSFLAPTSISSFWNLQRSKTYSSCMIFTCRVQIAAVCSVRSV